MHQFALVHLCILALSLSLMAQGSDRDRAEALSRRATERLQTLEREAERLASEEKTLLGELRKLEVERELRTEQLAQLDAQVAQIESALGGATERVTALQQQEAAARPKLVGRLVEMYKLGSARYVRLLLSTSDLRRVAEASRTVGALATLDRDRAVAHQQMLAELKATRATLEDRQTRLTRLRAGALTAQRAVARAARAHDELIRDIDSRRDLNAQLSGELQDAQTKLQATLRDMAAPGAAGATGTSSAAEQAALPLKPFRGDLDWPVAGTVRRHMSRAANSRAPAANAIEIAAAGAHRSRPFTTAWSPMPTCLPASATW